MIAMRKSPRNHKTNNKNANRTAFGGLYGSANKFTARTTTGNSTVLLDKTKIYKPINTAEEKGTDNMFIDNTNLQRAYSMNEVPIGAYTLDKGKTTERGAIAFMGAEDLLIQPFNCVSGVSTSSKQKLIKIKTKNSNISIDYLNNVAQAPTVEGTDYAKCKVTGPDTIPISSLPTDSRREIQMAKANNNNRLVDIIKEGDDSSNTSLPITAPMPMVRPTQQAIDSKQRTVQTTSKPGKVAAYVQSLIDIERGTSKGDGLFTFRYLFDEDDESAPKKGKVRLAYVTHHDSRTVLSKVKVRRDEWNNMLSDLSVFDAEMKCKRDLHLWDVKMNVTLEQQQLIQKELKLGKETE